MKTIIIRLALITLLVFNASALFSATQNLELRAGWNLISFAIQPADASISGVFAPLIRNGMFESIWTYDAINETWMTYPVPTAGIPAFENIEVGKGYWVKVTSSVELIISGTDIASGDLELTSGWNLVGFALREAKDYRYLLSGVPATQIWMYDADAGKFKGIEFATGTNSTTREDFSKIEPGKAYWIYSGQATTLGPVLGTSMEGDKDMPPFLSEGNPGDRIEWIEVSLGDEDIGGDGFFDSPQTQTAITFRDDQEIQRIYVNNTGSGILNFNVAILEPELNSWLKILVWDEDQEKDVPVTETSGSITTNTALIKITADRTGLAPATYTAHLKITSNGRSDKNPDRDITVIMEVATIEGDYELTAIIETVNGRKADMYNPRFKLSLYKDNKDPNDNSIKGIINEKLSLLIPERFYLTGQYYEDHSNRFSVSGSFILPSNDTTSDSKKERAEQNPYKTELRRDITLLGDRRGKEDADLGPLDLKGEYRETIRNVLKEPIYLAGTFVAKRVNKKATTLDESESYVQGDSIPDGTGELKKIITINPENNVLITEVDVSPVIEHEQPSDLKIVLESPTGTRVILRQNSNDRVGKVTYDEDTQPFQPMSSFMGEKSRGDWILFVQDLVPEKSGSLVECTLNIKGTRVYYISGRINNAPPGTVVLLTGCGVTQTVEVQPDGSFTFQDLVNCTYSITIIRPGYEQVTTEYTLDGESLSINLDMNKIVSGTPDFLLGPLGGNVPLTVSLTDITNLSSGQTYTYNWIISKIDSPTDIFTLPNHGSYVSYIFQTPGIYQAKMVIYNTNLPTLPVYTVSKPDLIIVGQPFDGSYRLVSYTLGGSGGIPNGKQESAFDSATFDLDRMPKQGYGKAPGVEDTEAFGSEKDPITLTNQVGSNLRLDAPVVSINSKHIYVYIGMGQPVVGSSTSGKLKLSIGSNP